MEQQTLVEIKFFNNSDGTSSDSKILYDEDDDGSQGKSAGLGDLELLTDPLHQFENWKIEYGLRIVNKKMPIPRWLMRVEWKNWLKLNIG